MRDWGEVNLQHRLSAIRWADDINLWPNAVLTFNHPFGVKIVFENSETIEIMIYGIHCSTHNNIPKLMSSHGVPLTLFESQIMAALVLCCLRDFDIVHATIDIKYAEYTLHVSRNRI